MKRELFVVAVILVGALLAFVGARIMEPSDGPSDPGADAVTVQLAFTGARGMQVNWDVSEVGLYDSAALVVPGHKDFIHGGMYCIKLTHIPGRSKEEYYSRIEVGPMTARTELFLRHNAVPIQFTTQDFEQTRNGNPVARVIYLLDPEYQLSEMAAIETLDITQSEPNDDQIREADRRGSILVIVRLSVTDFAQTTKGLSYQRVWSHLR